MDILAYLAIAVIAYLLGSISTGMLVSKAMGGPDLHKVGSGNTGATNALRTMGKKGGAIVFAGDVVKALLACLVGRLWMGQNGALLAGLFVILGHNWPVFFGFKGGKGVSSTCGVMLMTFWWQALICYVITIALIAITKFVSLGSLALVVLSPLLLVTYAAIWIDSPGASPIFTQQRVGRNGKLFKMYKFRTMYVQTEEEEQKGWTKKNDPRVTGVGKFLRKTSLDEFPQLFNVLKGDMSLVGPRPERPQYVEKFREEIPRYMIKHQVRPGMTGWAQVNGYRGDTSIRKRIEHDLYYIENWTLGLDVKILFLTVFKGFINKNAY